MYQKVMQSASRLLGRVVGSTYNNLKQGSTYFGGFRSIQTSSAASMPIKVNAINHFHTSILNALFVLSIIESLNRIFFQVGDKLPSVELFEGTPKDKVNIGDIVKGKRVVIFGVPGAFTPGCSKTHLPGYVQRADEIKGKNVAEIVCVSVNDPFVMGAWGEANGAQGKVRMLADPLAEFTKAVEMDLDLSAVLGTVRSKRYAMLVDDGVVKAVDVEPDNTGLNCSIADNFVKNL